MLIAFIHILNEDQLKMACKNVALVLNNENLPIRQAAFTLLSTMIIFHKFDFNTLQREVLEVQNNENSLCITNTLTILNILSTVHMET
jgi:hypothetical protein